MRIAMLVGMAFLHVSTAQVDPLLQVLFEAADMRGVFKDATGEWVKETARHAVKVVLDKAKQLANCGKPRTLCSEYDFVLDIPDVASFQDGWPLNFSSTTVYTLLDKSQAQGNMRIAIVALLGYYSKGKSFVLNHLYNAAKVIQNDPKWSEQWIGTGRRCVAEDADVSTRGISGVFTGFDTELEKASMLLLDTAGRNAPALQPPQKLDPGDLKNRITAMRAKERMIDDIITEIADTVLYVVDELLNEDQRTILHLVENAARLKTSQQIVIIHNWKRIDCNDIPTVDKMVQGQIIGPFAASEEVFEKNEKITYPGVRMWKSAWEYTSKVQFSHGPITNQVTHAAIFNDKLSACSTINVNTFKKLYSSLKLLRPDKPAESLLERFGKVAYSNMGKFVMAVPSTAAEKHERKRLELQPNNPRCDAKLRVDIAGGEVELQPLEWELRDMPRPAQLQNTDNILNVPRSRMYEGNDNKLYIRVDLPGFKESDQRKNKDFPAESESEKFHWWGWRMDKQRSHKILLVTGHRQKPSGFQDDDGTDETHVGQSFGLFKLPFHITDNTFDSKPTVHFEDATLKIIIARSEESDQ
jgi:hypothetical protein